MVAWSRGWVFFTRIWWSWTPRFLLAAFVLGGLTLPARWFGRRTAHLHTVGEFVEIELSSTPQNVRVLLVLNNDNVETKNGNKTA